MMRIGIMLIAICLLLLAGCNKPAPTATARPATATRRPTPATGSDNRSTARRPAAPSTQAAPPAAPPTNSVASLPDGWPSWLPEYPGSRITLANVQESLHPDVRVHNMVLETGSQPADVAQYYREKAQAKGLIADVNLTDAEGGCIATFKNGEISLSIAVSKVASGTQARIMLRTPISAINL